jgi:hypothetical protein
MRGVAQLKRVVGDLMHCEEKTSNIQHSTSNIQWSAFGRPLDVGRSMLEVGCSQKFVGR